MKMTRPDDDDVVTDLDEILLTDLSVGRGAARESPRLAWEEGAGQHQHQQGLGEHLHQHLKKQGLGDPALSTWSAWEVGQHQHHQGQQHQQGVGDNYHQHLKLSKWGSQVSMVSMGGGCGGNISRLTAKSGVGWQSQHF